MNYFTKQEENEIKYMWLNLCLSIKEIAKWSGIKKSAVKKYVKKITVDEHEFQEKSKGFAEFLKEHPNNKKAEKMIAKRKKRLIEAYDRTRHLK